MPKDTFYFSENYSGQDPAVSQVVKEEVLRLLNLGYYEAHWPLPWNAVDAHRTRVTEVILDEDNHRLIIRSAKGEHIVDLWLGFILHPGTLGYREGMIMVLCYNHKLYDDGIIGRFTFLAPEPEDDQPPLCGMLTLADQLEISRQRIDAIDPRTS